MEKSEIRRPVHSNAGRIPLALWRTGRAQPGTQNRECRRDGGPTACVDRKEAYRRAGYEQRTRPEAQLADLDLELARSFAARTVFSQRPIEEVLERYGLILPQPGGVRETFRLAGQLHAISVHLPCADIRTPAVNLARESGFRLFAYTANSTFGLRRLIAAGVDGIFTNYPDRLHTLLRQDMPHAKQ